MAVSPFKTFAGGEILTASDLNSSFSQVFDNGQDLGWPATKAKDLDGNVLILDGDGDTTITADTDDQIDYQLGGVDVFRMKTVASAVNGLDLIASATATELAITAFGTDTNIDIALNPKGGGHVVGIPLTRNIIDGCALSPGTDTLFDIDVAAGVCADSTNAVGITVAAITKQIDVNWAEGTNAGGFPSGLTLTADLTYHFFTIRKTDGTTDAGFDTSLTATNLLADATAYTYFRRLGSVIMNGSATAFFPFAQRGDKFLWDVYKSDVNDVNPGTSRVIKTLTVPTGIVVDAICTCQLSDVTPVGGTVAIFTDVAHTDAAPTGTNHDVAVGGDSEIGTVVKELRTDTSGQMAYRITVTSTDHVVRVDTQGWIDSRGKE